MERSCSVCCACRRLLRRVIRGRLTALAVLPVFPWVLAAPAAAQEGGVVAPVCTHDPWCADDALEIVFESGSSTYEGPVEPGVEVPIEVVIDARSPDIQGYSWAVKHDGEFLSLIPGSLSIAGTIIDPESPDTAVKAEHFSVHRVVEGGFVAAVVLALREQAALPLGRNVICRAAYEVTAAPDCTVIRFVDRQLAVTNSPSVSVNITASGLSRVPRFFRHGLIRTGDCPETCDDLADNDGDGQADCEDPDCSADFRCTGEESCDDGIDNNANGGIDCVDPRCRGTLDCQGVEACGDGLDNDGDGLADCDDPDCSPSRACRAFEVCNDGIDDDGDGQIDCDDLDCRFLPGCRAPEVCNDGIDNDRDGSTDCLDRDCGGIDGCPEFEVCGDGIDDDGDGQIDCEDRDCWFLPGCRAPEVCDDGADNDRDGLTDCRDPDCRGDVACQERCDDGIDNDGDGQIDCDDLDCRSLPGCRTPEACDDGADNDADGWTDCHDLDCLGKDVCLEVCDDGTDNDADDWVDCADPDCLGSPGCEGQESCEDGTDNDGDSLVDCLDPDCPQPPCGSFNWGERVEVCSDGIDNDEDGFVDELDGDCNQDHCSECASPLAGATPPPALIRGDADGSGRLTVLDAIVVVRVAVNGGEPPFDCFAALETNGDDGVNIADALPILRWIFLDGPPLPGPFPDCGLLIDGCRESSPGCG